MHSLQKSLQLLKELEKFQKQYLWARKTHGAKIIAAIAFFSLWFVFEIKPLWLDFILVFVWAFVSVIFYILIGGRQKEKSAASIRNTLEELFQDAEIKRCAEELVARRSDLNFAFIGTSILINTLGTPEELPLNSAVEALIIGRSHAAQDR